ncbi:lactonase family protein [Chryseobacterium shigense]|uniref:6-phosphogluconolactonase (Cycloisomerase 2 family) n=1 Tax=Chryseobacterium shigense TaxID=297244 RepID=A0A841NF67_9FLAO|nr:lactonase family protein [Chryseobacterium shigense]MBB6372468.1 6-phosphogluconolactonase (cycloisomerase 2 family) [Chryseobacterium shigense]
MTNQIKQLKKPFLKLKSTLSLIILLVTSIHLYSQKTYVFFGSFNRDKATEGLYVYQLDTIKGKLSKVTSVKGILNPSFLTLSPDAQYVFACTESKTPNAGSVSSFAFNPEDGKLTFINSQKSGGENPVYVMAHKNGKWLVNANYTEGSVSVYPVSENGTIQPYVQNFQFSEGSINKQRQDRSHVHAAVFSPDFKQLFLPDLGADKIRSYTFDSDKTEPLQAAQQPYISSVSGSGPRHLTFHPNGKFAYCINELSGTIDAYLYANSSLESIQRIATHTDRYKEDFESSDIHISPDGKFLYASNRGYENNIAIFSVLEDGTLKNIGYQPTFGKQLRVFDMDETGKFLIAANAASGDAFVFRRNPETGLLKKVGRRTKMFGVSSVKIRKY